MLLSVYPKVSKLNLIKMLPLSHWGNSMGLYDALGLVCGP